MGVTYPAVRVPNANTVTEMFCLYMKKWVLWVICFPGLKCPVPCSRSCWLSKLIWGPTFSQSLSSLLWLFSVSSASESYMTLSPSSKPLITRLSCVVHHSVKWVILVSQCSSKWAGPMSLCLSLFLGPAQEKHVETEHKERIEHPCWWVD